MMNNAHSTIAFVAGDNLVAHLLLQNILPGVVAAGFKPILFVTPGSSKINKVPSLQHYSFYEGAILSDVIYPALEKESSKGPYQSMDRFLDSLDCESIAITSYDDASFMNAIASPALAGIISLRNYSIFPEKLIAQIKERSFLWNLHTGSLPDYRGVFIPFWSMRNGENAYGWTLHDVDAGIDTGLVIDSCTLPLNTKSVLHAYTDLVEDGADMVLRALNNRTDGSLQLVKQPAPAAYYSFPTQAEIDQARAQGVKLWGSPADMLRLYQQLFGYDEDLAEGLMQAILHHEDASQKDIVKLPQAA